MPATQQVITELIIDARPAVAGEQQFEQTMAKASAAAQRQSGVMLQTGQSAGKLGAALERLKAQSDPLYAINQKLEKGLGTLDAAYRRGLITETEAASVKSRLIAIRDRDTASLIREGAAATRTATALGLLKDISLGFVGGIGAGLAIGSLSQLPRILSDTVEQLGNIANKAQTIGITTDALQELRYAARLSDVEVGTLDDALAKFSVNAGKIGSPLQKIFEANSKALTGDLMKDLETYADLIKNATNQEQRNVLVTTAFGKSAQEMGRLFEDGGRGIARWASEARAAGAVMENSLIERARVLNDQMEALKPQLEAAQAELAMLIVPAQIAILSTFNELIAETRAILTDITNLDLGGLFSKLGQLGVVFSNITTGNWIGATTQLQMMQLQRKAVEITIPVGTGGGSSSTTPTTLPSTADEKAARAAESLKKAYDSLIASVQQRIAQAELEARAVGLTSEEVLRLKNEQELLQHAETRGIDLNSQSADGLRTKREELIALAAQETVAEQAAKDASKAAEDQARVADKLAESLGTVANALLDMTGMSDTPLGAAVNGALGSLMKGDWLGAIIGGITSVITWFIGQAQEVQEAKDALIDQADDIASYIATSVGDASSAAAESMAAFIEQGEAFIELAETAGDAALVAQLRAANDNYRSTLGTEYQNDIAAQIRDLNGEGGLNDASDALEAFAGHLADAAYLGIDASSATELLRLQLQALVNEGSITEDQIASLVSAFPDLADEIAAVLDTISTGTGVSVDQAQAWVDNRRAALEAAYRKESAALQDVIDTAKNAITTLRNFKESLQLGEQSPLSPFDQMMAAKAVYDSTATAALAGDQDAIAKLPDVMQSYLQTAQGYYANSAEYVAIFDQVNATLDEALLKAEDQVDVAEAQLDALDASVSKLIDIDDSVLSVAEAIRSLKDALGGLSAAGGFDAESYWSATLKDFYAALQDYKSASGSATIPSAIAGVWNAFANATSASQYDQLASMYADKLREITADYSGTSVTSSALTSSSASSILSVPSVPSGSAANSNSVLAGLLKEISTKQDKIVAATATSAIHVAQRVDANTDEAANAARVARHEQRRTGTNG